MQNSVVSLLVSERGQKEGFAHIHWHVTVVIQIIFKRVLSGARTPRGSSLHLQSRASIQYKRRPFVSGKFPELTVESSPSRFGN